MNKNNFKIEGFTLVEMAIVLVIVGLLMAAFLSPLSAQIDQKDYGETRRLLDDSKDALLGYAVVNKHLPCPDKTAGASNGVNDSANDGVEDFDVLTGFCIAQEGNLPWATLSLPSNDSWGQQFIYRVTATYSNRSPQPTFSLLSAVGNLRVCNQQTCSTPRLTDTAIAVIVSRGKNRGICSTLPSPPACIDETANNDGNNDFVSHVQTASGSANGEFDDVVVWVSSNILFNRMVNAGQLP